MIEFIVYAMYCIVLFIFILKYLILRDLIKHYKWLCNEQNKIAKNNNEYISELQQDNLRLYKENCELLESISKEIKNKE